MEISARVMITDIVSSARERQNITHAVNAATRKPTPYTPRSANVTNRVGGASA